jgi:uncharacterized protein (UPF0216 family)
VAAASIRTRPLIAVLSRVPLLVEALVGAFSGIADVQAVASDDVEAQGLVRAFRPDAVIAEGDSIDLIDADMPCVHVELETQTVSVREGGLWRIVDIELSPEGIRNATVAQLYGGELA